MKDRSKIALKQIAQELRNALNEFDQPSQKRFYVLLNADDHIRELVQNEYFDIPAAVFLQFFYSNFRYHLWMHVTGDASLRISDTMSTNIINKIKIGLNNLVIGLENDDRIKIYEALIETTYGYLDELSKEE